ncbi:acyl-CoA thioesterase II [Rhodobacterales bacterium 52_120_T64]|nr:acyl-CoA thioesterase II [Rhodobacterales bacterium 52_120_T64]
MNSSATELLNFLELEFKGADNFHGTGAGGESSTRIFGGHVIAQSLMAACMTVPQDRPCHSLHAYFLRPGNTSLPVEYEVERSRDGRGFSNRRVIAVQNGKQILNMTASFHLPREGWSHQHPMPDVPGPEGIKERAQLRAESAHLINEDRRADFLLDRPIEIRETAPRHFIAPEPTDDHANMWFRMKAAKGSDPRIQQCILAYASDLNLLEASLRPHGLTWFQERVATASLDHAIWFHAPVQFENWHLYSVDSPWAGDERSFNRGAIYSQDGELVASVTQEALLRKI